VSPATARGGEGAAGGPRDGWDNSVPYLQRTFGPDVFGGDLTLIETPLTLADHNPRMAPLREKAAELRAQSLVRANQLGRSLALEAGATTVP
jgi:FMN-dependent NADH-azoreductase